MAPTFREVPIGSLRFDEQNPRLPHSIDGASQSEVLAFMLNDAGLLDLMRSIAKQGFFPGEPLLVSPLGSDFVVVEGNRRFASCLLLNEPDLAPTRRRQVADAAEEARGKNLEKLPCLVFSTRNEILNHLGYRHVTGIKEWEPLAKARFIHQRFQALSGEPADRFKDIARSIGSRADYVGRLLTAYTLFAKIEKEHFYDQPNLDSDSIDFSLITSLLAYSDIVKYLGLASSQDIFAKNLDSSRLRFLMLFVFERNQGKTRLGESRNIRTLSNILGNERAREALESGASLAAASKLAGIGADAFRSLIGGARENIDLAFRELEGASIGQDDIDAIHDVTVAAADLEKRAIKHVASSSHVRRV